MLTMDDRRKRLLIRAWRRGFREMDMIMGGYAQSRLDQLNEAELAEFETLLGLADQTVYGWIIGREDAPLEHQSPILEALKAYRPTIDGLQRGEAG
jgi:antitoxin CptB